MTKCFKKISASELTENQVKLWDKDWLLITAGDLKQHNMMTASWGGMGYLWNKPVVFIFIRPSRLTYQFTEKYEYFTLTAYDEQHRDALKLCGSKSGRDCNKTFETGLTPFQSPEGSVYFEEAKLQIECKKIYFQDINNHHFILPELESHYADKQYHRMYIGEITEILICDN